MIPHYNRLCRRRLVSAMRIFPTASGMLLLMIAALGSACGGGQTAALPTPVLPTAAIPTPTRALTSVAQTATPTRPGGSPTPQTTGTPSTATPSTTTPPSTGSAAADAFIRALAAAKVTATQVSQTVSCGSGPGSTGHVWQASAVTDQQQFVLWVYPDHASLEADWTAEIGNAPLPRLASCVTGGSGSWNGNMILYVQGRDLGTLTTAIRNAFLSVGD